MTTTLQDIRLGQLRQHPNNPRRTVGDVSDLAASIVEQGILEPLIVAPVESKAADPQYVVIAGHRRHAAAKVAKCKTVPCLVRDDLTDPAHQLEAMLVENLQRTDLTPVEEGDAYQQLLEFDGYTQKKITTATGRPAATVRGRLRLAKLPLDTKSKIQSGQISMGDALALADFANDSARYKVLEKAIGTSNWSWKLDEAKRGRNRDRKIQASRKELDAAGVRLLKVRPGFASLFLRGKKDVEAHRECPGFAAFLGYDGSPEYVCDKPELHKAEATAAAATGDRSAQDAARAAAAAELVEAALARRSFIAGKILGGGFTTDSLLASLVDGVVKEALKHGDDALHTLHSMLTLGHDVVVPDEAVFDDEAIGLMRDELVAALSEMNVNQLMMCVDFMDHWQEDDVLLDPDGWGVNRYRSDWTKPWRDRLVEAYGYEWTQAELDAVPAPAIVDVNLPDPVE